VTFPAPSRKDHDTFCTTEGWTPVRNDRSKTGHHVTYELVLSDGAVLRTRVSRPPNKDTYGKSLWAHILRDQLQVSDAEFWACVKDGILPTRSQQQAPTDAIPAGVVHQLVTHVGLSKDDVTAMTKDEGIDRLHHFRTYGT
jgi:hypothetical protein